MTLQAGTGVASRRHAGSVGVRTQRATKYGRNQRVGMWLSTERLDADQARAGASAGLHWTARAGAAALYGLHRRCRSCAGVRAYRTTQTIACDADLIRLAKLIDVRRFHSLEHGVAFTMGFLRPEHTTALSLHGRIRMVPASAIDIGDAL